MLTVLWYSWPKIFHQAHCWDPYTVRSRDSSSTSYEHWSHLFLGTEDPRNIRYTFWHLWRLWNSRYSVRSWRIPQIEPRRLRAWLGLGRYAILNWNLINQLQKHYRYFLESMEALGCPVRRPIVMDPTDRHIMDSDCLCNWYSSRRENLSWLILQPTSAIPPLFIHRPTSAGVGDAVSFQKYV